MRPAKEIAREIVADLDRFLPQEGKLHDLCVETVAAAIEKDRSERDCGSHHWFKYNDMDCCKKCGNVRRADDKNSRCRGKVNIELRPAPTAPAFPSEEINAAAAHAARDFEGCQGEQSYPARYGFLQGVRWVKEKMGGAK